MLNDTSSSQLLNVVFVIVTVPDVWACTQSPPSRIVAPLRSALPPLSTRRPDQSEGDGETALLDRKVTPGPALSVPATISAPGLNDTSVPEPRLNVTPEGILTSPSTQTAEYRKKLGTYRYYSRTKPSFSQAPR